MTKRKKNKKRRRRKIDSNNKICSEKLVDLYCTIGDKNCEKSIDYLLGIDSNQTAM